MIQVRAINGCEKAENAKIFILFPHKKVSEIQRKQMTTNKSKNVFNIAVKEILTTVKN